MRSRLIKSLILVAIMFTMTLCSFLSPIGLVSFAESGCRVTFDYNIESIIDYIPANDTLRYSLSNYSKVVDFGSIADETRKPISSLTMFYTYKWTVDGNIVDMGNYLITEDTVFEAVWTPRTYNVYFTFESDEVKNLITNLQTKLAFTIETPRTEYYIPNLPNYRFVGWYTSGSPIIQHYLAPRTTGDIVLMAKFLPKEFEINYNTNARNANPNFYKVTDNNITLLNPERDGHIFKGWFGDQECTQQVTSIDCSKGGDINIYPLWEVETYEVTYILPDGTEKVITAEYGQKASLPKLYNKGLFEIVRTDVSRNNITDDTVIHIEYVSIWYIYLIILVGIVGIITLIIYMKKRKENTHNRLRAFYQSNTNKNKRK